MNSRTRISGVLILVAAVFALAGLGLRSVQATTLSFGPGSYAGPWTLDAASNTFHVELRFENPGEALKEGMIVQARVDYLRYPDAITIPLKAIRVADVDPRVFVAERRDGKDFAAVRDVEPVAIKGESVLVSRGVAAGDRLIVAGMKGVIHGEEINVVMEDGVLVGAASGNGGAENRAEP